MEFSSIEQYDASDVQELLAKYDIKPLLTDGQQPDIECSICHKVMVDAHLGPCSCRYCRVCIDKTSDGKDIKQCPGTRRICKQISSDFSAQLQPDVNINRKIATLEIKCPMEECSHRDFVHKMICHLNVCPFAEHRCPFYIVGCNFDDSSLEDHINSNVVQHIEFLFNYIISSNLQIENLTKYLSDLTEFKLPEVSPRTSPDHVIDSKGCFGKHDSKDGILNVICNLARKLDNIENELADLRTDLNNLTKMNVDGHFEQPPLQCNATIEALANEIEELHTSIERGQQFQRTTADILQQVHQNFQADTETTIQNLRAQVQELEERLRQSHSRQVKTNGIIVPVEQENGIEFIEPKTFVLQFFNMRIPPLCGQFEWRINNFSRLRTNAQSGNVLYKNSPVFYSEEKGYSFCLTVGPNGVYHQQGTHVFIGFALLSGDHDNQLEWPCRSTIEISLLRHGYNEAFQTVQYQYDTTPDDYKFCFSKRTETAIVSLGHSNFVRWADLLANNSVYIDDSITVLCRISNRSRGCSESSSGRESGTSS